MIKIRNTENLVGITILGDYEDLSTLRDAISDYTNLHMSNSENDAAYHCYECILGLCYDIRHAYQGDRGFESVPNGSENIASLAQCIYEFSPETKKKINTNKRLYKNGNLYFSADILYPWAVYYLFALESLVEESYQSDWFENIDFDYDELRAMRDEALIQYFVQLLWECVQKVLPEETFALLRDYVLTFNHKDFYISYPDLYLRWVCHYWISSLGNKENRLSMLPMLCLELTPIHLEDEGELLEEPDSDDERVSSLVRDINQMTLRCMRLYDQNLKMSRDVGSHPFQTCDENYLELGRYVREHGPFTEWSFDEYLTDELGPVDWDALEW